MKLVMGVGVNDLKGESQTVEYKRWLAMLGRCYGKYQAQISYHDCTVCDEWHTYSHFKQWLSSFGDITGMEIDKDILSGVLYSPETCLVVPRWLNSFLIGENRKSQLPKGVTDVSYKNKTNPYKVSIGKSHYGYFSNIYEAHLAWKKAKLTFVEDNRNKLDEIDKRIYPALLKRYS